MINNSPILRVNSDTVLTINNKTIEVDTTLNSVTLTIPLVTNDTYELNVIDIMGNASVNNIIIETQPPYTINLAPSITLSSDFANATITYDGSGNYAATIHDNGGGSGGITLVRNGLTENPVGTVSLGGTIQDNPTTINTDGNQFRIGNVNADGAGLIIEFDYNQLLSSVNNQLRTDDSLNYSLLDQFNNKIEITSFDSVSNTTSILRVGEKFATRGIFLDHLDAGMNSQIIMDSTRSQFSYSDGVDYALILTQMNNASMNVTTGILSSTISIDNNIGRISINSDLCELFINTPTTSMAANGAVLTLLDNTTGECQFVSEWTETIVNLSALDILALGSGVVLLPSLISGEYYNIDSIIIEFSPNTTPYTMAGIGNIQLSYGTASVYIDNQFILGFSENVVMIKDPIKSSGTAVYNYIDSTAGDTVVLTTDTGLSPLVGDGTAKAKIKYKIETFGL